MTNLIRHACAGSGPRVLFVQGSGLPGAGWSPQLDGLRDRFTCASFDHRGTGASPEMPPDFAFEHLTADTLAVMDALGWSDAHVVGHSIGGLIATSVALAAPARVRSLSLMCSFLRGREASRMTPWVVWTGMRTMVGTRRMRRHAFLEMVLSAEERRSRDLDAIGDEFRPLFGRDLGDPSKTALRQLRATAKYDPSSRLAEIAVPTLVVSASHDRIAPPEIGRTLAAAIPGARFEIVEGAAHGLPITRAAEANALLAEHILSAERRAGSAAVAH